MSAPGNAQARPRRARLARAPALVAPLLAGGTLAVGLARVRPELVTGATVAAACCAWYSWRLIRLALRLHRDPDPPAEPGGPDAVGSCRSAGLLGLATATSGATCVAVAVMVVTHRSPEAESLVVAAGLAGFTGLVLPALLLLPGAAVDPVSRLRRGLDGLSVGVLLLFTAWVLVIAPHGRVVSLGFWVALLSCSTISVATVTALRAARRWRSALACSTSVVLSAIGLAWLTLGLANASATAPAVAWPTVCLSLVAAAPVVAWLGAVRAVTIAEGLSSTADLAGGALAGFPVLALPAVAAISVATFRLVEGGRFDKPSVVLGVIGIVAVALRESLAAVDLSRFARHVVTQEAHFRSLVSGSTDVTVVVDRDLVVRWQSPAAARQFGLSDQDVVGRRFLSLLHPDDASLVGERFTDLLASRWQHGTPDSRPSLVEARLRDGFGRWRDTESTITDQLDAPEVRAVVLHVRDVGERKELEHTLHRVSFVDHQTGLANRRQLVLTVVSLRAVPRGRGALLHLALDGFSSVNDMRGYEVGDAVLIEVARRLRASVDGTDLPARLGGDEFAVVTAGGPVQAYALACRLVTVMAEPVVLPGTTVRLTASVGLTDLAGDGSVDDMLRRANLALHRARQLGRGRVEWHDTAMESELLRRMTLEQELPGVLDRDELDLVYQPVLDLAEDRPLGVEALLRWRHPRLGTVLPGDIIPVAEQIGMEDQIGGWVLRQACRQLSGWLGEGRDLWMSINVSAGQLCAADHADQVATALERYGVPAERLLVEVGETGIGADTAALAARLGALRTLGLRTALDDFGAGSASLAHLRCLPVDLIKIGKPFFADRPGPRPMAGQTGYVAAKPIIEVMVGLGRRLGIEVIASGLEAAAHLDVVRGAGCRLGQGHLFAPPQPAERVEAYLDSYGRRHR